MLSSWGGAIGYLAPRDWSRLVYPLLVGIGLKMVVQDFTYSRPATLFLALALYGTALILAPRMRRTSLD